MGLVINTNVMSLNAQRQLGKSQSSLNTSMERLSSGLRINSAKDDAAGLAISDRMTSQIRGLNQAARNANDGISLAQTAEGALQESTNILQRIRELAVQSANDTNTASDRSSLNDEVIQLQEELDRIATTTEFNGKTVIDGSMTDATFQVGSNAGTAQTISFGIESALAADLSAVGTTIDSPNALATTDVSGTAIEAGALTINGEDMIATDGTNTGLAAAINDAVGAGTATVQNVQTLDFTAVTLNGTDNQTETATFTFADLNAGQSVTIDGMTVTATGGTATAADIASAFSGTDAGNAVASGSLSNYSTSDGLAFVSNTANTDIAVDLAATVSSTADPAVPGVSVSQGSAAAPEIFTLNLTGGFDTADTVSFEGISVAAGADDQTAAQMAATFAAAYNGDGSETWIADASANDGTIVFTADTSEVRTEIVAGDFTVTVATDDGAHTVDPPTQDGAADVTESATFTFADLAEGQSVTIDGMTVTATGGTALAADIASAFNGTDNGNAVASGTLAGYTTSDGLTFTSGTANTNVADLAATVGSPADPSVPSVSVVQGAAASVDGTYSLTIGSDTIDLAAEVGVELTAAAVAAEIDGLSDYSAEVNDEGQIQITAASNAAFSMSETIDLDGVGAGAAEGTTSGFTTIGSTATDLQGQVVLTSDADIVIEEVTSGAMTSAGLQSVDADGNDVYVGNATTTIDNVDVLTRESAVIAIESVDAALSDIDEIRGGLGAVQNRFTSTINNLNNVAENLSAARSRILDADIAMESSNMTKQNILQQAGVSILAQANQAPQLALSLIG